MYKYEIHLHDSYCSHCSVSTPRQLIDVAIKKGFSGVVFTNHFLHGNTKISRDLPWKEFVDHYLYSYYAAKEYGKAIDFDVLFGIEEQYVSGKEFLVYGLEPELIRDASELQNPDPHIWSEFVHKHNGIMVAAHPFRERSYISDPNLPPPEGCFDGIEVHNHFNTEEQNKKALTYAKENNLQFFCGGDIHWDLDFAECGLVFDHRIRTNKDFVKAIHEHNYMINVEGEFLPSN